MKYALAIIIAAILVGGASYTYVKIGEQKTREQELAVRKAESAQKKAEAEKKKAEAEQRKAEAFEIMGDLDDQTEVAADQFGARVRARLRISVFDLLG